jgi:hypothetical protein
MFVYMPDNMLSIEFKVAMTYPFTTRKPRHLLLTPPAPAQH